MRSRTLRRPPSVWPPLTDWVTFYAPMTRDFGMEPVYSAAGDQAPTTETVDGDGTYTEQYSGNIVDATANEARVGDGVLSEVASTNQALRSEEFDNASWTKTGITVTADDTTAPDGNDTADSLSGGGGTYANQTVGGNNTDDHVASVWLKANTAKTVELRLGASGNYVYATCSIDDGVVDATGTGGTGVVTASGVETGPSDWYRFWISGNTIGSGANIAIALYNRQGVEAAFYAWGAQVENDRVAPTSYVPTTTAAIARAADVLEYTGASNISLSAGTFHIAANVDALHSAEQYLADIYVDADDRISLFLDSSGKPKVVVNDGGSEQAALTATSALTPGTTAIISVAWDTDDVRLYVDGADEQSDTSATMPSGSHGLHIGKDGTDGSQFCGYLKHAVGYSVAQSAAEVLQTVQWMQTRSGDL